MNRRALQSAAQCSHRGLAIIPPPFINVNPRLCRGQERTPLYTDYPDPAYWDKFPKTGDARRKQRRHKRIRSRNQRKSNGTTSRFRTTRPTTTQRPNTKHRSSKHCNALDITTATKDIGRLGEQLGAPYSCSDDWQSEWSQQPGGSSSSSGSR